MPPTPRKTIDPEFIAELDCPICGQDALRLKSLANYPDFVTCGNCDSQFAAEQDGDRIMYGKIPATYPRTRRFALQQWAWPEAIARRAFDERPEGSAPSQAPAEEPPPPISPPAEEPEASEESVTELPAPTEFQPDEIEQDQPLIEPESAIQEETLRQELSPAADWEEAAEPAPEAAIEEPQLEAPEEEESELPAPDTLEPESMVDDPSLTAAEADTVDEDFLTELSDDFDSEPADFTFASEESEEPVPPPADTDEQPVDELDEPPVPADTLEQPVEEAAPISAESDVQDEPLREELSEDSESLADWAMEEDTEDLAEPSDEDFFAEAEAETEEADFSFFDEPAEAEAAGEWDEADEEAEDLFAPPFGEAEAEEADTMPADFEPAPDMPDWLSQPESEADDEFRQEGSEMEPIDFTGLRDEVEDEPADSGFGEEEDLLASLWGDEDEADSEFGDEDDSFELDDELAGFAGLGAISEEAESEDPLDDPDEQAADMWADEPAAEPPITQPGPPEAEEAPQDAELAEEEQRAQIARTQWAGAESEEQAQAEPPPELAAALTEEEELSFEAEEPPPGERYRVVLQNHQAQFPEELCAHCSQSPTVTNLSVTASVYRGAGVGERQVVTYRVPVCAECRDRAKARSDERQTAQLQAHLISVLVAMILVVSALAFRLVDFQGRIGFDLGILFLLAVMGYAIPVTFLLIRASRIGKPADAKYVETTLRVPGDTEGAETAFEFRNQRYAHFFQHKNEKEAVSGVNKVRERQYEPETG